MSKRKVNLSPQFNYEFQKNQIYQDSWQFLKNPDRSKIIASQLAYLEFHSWLHANIKTQSEVDLKNIPLIGDISEGFIRTDILLYGAILETILFDVIENEYKVKNNRIKDIIDCFEKLEQKKLPINNTEFSIHQQPSPQKGKLFLLWDKTIMNDTAYITFEKLIIASESIGLIDGNLKNRLDIVRKDRNTIHLAEQIKRKKIDKHSFTSDDRKRVKDILEELKNKVIAWYS